MKANGLPLALVGLLCCVGCGGNGDTKANGTNGAVQLAEPPADRQSLFRVCTIDLKPLSEVITREWEEFHTTAGAKLKLDVCAFDRRTLHQSLFSDGGLAGGDWDLALPSADWLAEAEQSGALADLTSRLKQDPPDGYPDDWPESLLQPAQVSGKVLGLPYHGGPTCFVYRRDMVEDPMLRKVYYAKYGYEIDVPRTWEEFRRIAEFVNRPEVHEYALLPPALPGSQGTVPDVCLQLWTRGGRLFDGDGKLKLDTPKMIEALTFYRLLVTDKYITHPEYRRFDAMAAGEAFVRGEVFMAIAPWGVAAMAETRTDSQVKGQVGVAPVPHSATGESISLSSVWVLSIPAGSQQRDLAYRFARHCVGSAADKQRTLRGVAGCRRSTWSDPDVQAAIPWHARWEELLSTARRFPPRADWDQIAGLIDDMAQQAIHTDRPLDSIVRRAQQEADRLPAGR